MNRTRTNDRARRFASGCAYGLTIVLPLSFFSATADAQSRWSSSATQAPPAAATTTAPEKKVTLPQAVPPTSPAPAATIPTTNTPTTRTALLPSNPPVPSSGAVPSTAPPVTATPPAAQRYAPMTPPAIAATPAASQRTDLPPKPGLKRLPPVDAVATPQSVAASTIPPAPPIDWERPTMVMGPLPPKPTPHHSPVRLISNTANVPSPEQGPQAPPATPIGAVPNEIIPAHTTPQNGATPSAVPPQEEAPEVTPAASRYNAATAPVNKPTATKIMPRYAATSELANPAEKNLLPPTDKPHFARVTDESMSSPAPQDGLSPIYVCRLLGLKAAK